MTTTDVFSLARVTADELRWAEEPWRRQPCHRATGIGPLQLARLAELLGIGGHDEFIREFSLLAGEIQETPWVVSFPERLMSRIGALDEGDAGAVAVRWADALDPALGVSPDALRAYLRGLRVFAARSVGPYALYVRQAAK